MPPSFPDESIKTELKSAIWFEKRMSGWLKMESSLEKMQVLQRWESIKKSIGWKVQQALWSVFRGEKIESWHTGQVGWYMYLCSNVKSSAPLWFILNIQSKRTVRKCLAAVFLGLCLGLCFVFFGFLFVFYLCFVVDRRSAHRSACYQAEQPGGFELRRRWSSSSQHSAAAQAVIEN